MATAWAALLARKVSSWHDLSRLTNERSCAMIA